MSKSQPTGPISRRFFASAFAAAASSLVAPKLFAAGPDLKQNDGWEKSKEILKKHNEYIAQQIKAELEIAENNQPSAADPSMSVGSEKLLKDPQHRLQIHRRTVGCVIGIRTGATNIKGSGVYLGHGVVAFAQHQLQDVVEHKIGFQTAKNEPLTFATLKPIKFSDEYHDLTFGVMEDICELTLGPQTDGKIPAILSAVRGSDKYLRPVLWGDISYDKTTTEQTSIAVGYQFFNGNQNIFGYLHATLITFMRITPSTKVKKNKDDMAPEDQFCPLKGIGYTGHGMSGGGVFRNEIFEGIITAGNFLNSAIFCPAVLVRAAFVKHFPAKAKAMKLSMPDLDLLPQECRPDFTPKVNGSAAPAQK